MTADVCEKMEVDIHNASIKMRGYQPGDATRYNIDIRLAKRDWKPVYNVQIRFYREERRGADISSLLLENILERIAFRHPSKRSQFFGCDSIIDEFANDADITNRWTAFVALLAAAVFHAGGYGNSSLLELPGTIYSGDYKRASRDAADLLGMTALSL